MSTKVKFFPTLEEAEKKAEEIRAKHPHIEVVRNLQGGYRVILRPVKNGPSYHLREDGTFLP